MQAFKRGQTPYKALAVGDIQEVKFTIDGLMAKSNIGVFLTMDLNEEFGITNICHTQQISPEDNTFVVPLSRKQLGTHIFGIRIRSIGYNEINFGVTRSESLDIRINVRQSVDILYES